MTIGGTLTQNSDQRLKKDIVGLTNSANKIEKLNGYHYNWIAEDRDQALQTGLIAQEVKALFPELVSTNDEGYLSVNYIGLIPHLIEANKNKDADIKKQGELIEKLGERLLALENQFGNTKTVSN
ncbi:tail fiber domain-containing protein [Arcticibacterium luteifluviistationis]|uniref:Peptidase S74 domain-containing protein n=1 Tax=Arcticibacterium luteifluviistationis TaxID=1784714 RepID=A0A2Z4GCB3_9BACT|nr:tail fiber domain-containing protein [Arcticibacterium luteifluviistationis]AWV98777.1 hypothetical protein DJ013_11565 [Arcticibacterium luteifluviistationis]